MPDLFIFSLTAEILFLLLYLLSRLCIVCIDINFIIYILLKIGFFKYFNILI